MAWGPIVVGVDASPAAKGAGIVGERLAQLASVPCQLVHAVPTSQLVAPVGVAAAALPERRQRRVATLS